MPSKLTTLLILVLAISVILLSACAPETSTLTAVNRTSTVPSDTPTALSTPIPTIHLPETDAVILIIPNPQPFLGREGEPRPDWLGWGAETFVIGPDGGLWLADSAANPKRLLHFTHQGELLQEISLQDLIVYPFDLAIIQDTLWVLDVSAEKPKVVQLSLTGDPLASLEIPREIMTVKGEFVANGIFNLWVGENGELLTSGVNGLHILLDSTGEVVAQPLESFSFYGHTYQAAFDQTKDLLTLAVDGNLIQIDQPYFIESEPFLGFNHDGSFAIATRKEMAAEGEVPGAEIEWLVHYYSASGEFLGLARRWPRYLWRDYNHDLTFGPDGGVYQLVSNPDHSVQIVRLGFSHKLPPIAQIEPTATPTPLSPLKPTWTTLHPEASEEEQARHALLTFLDALSDGRYAEASSLYGGNFEDIPIYPLEGESPDEYWGRACQVLLCLPVLAITDGEKISEDEFKFYVEFIWVDGRRFEFGACCGADPAEIPPVWQFTYPVRKIDGQWKVIRGPLFMP